ncbi:MAG: aminopeptidase [Desulfuromonas sp.]|nr:aminopeptidase [Desulfuromonas sp.]
MKSSWVVKALLSVSLPLLAACSDVGYCVQCVTGHLDVMNRTRPIEAVLKDQSVPEAERAQLARVLKIRAFAVDELGLPDNDSYRIYANLGRPYVVWNVVATSEFSFAPKQWCYPIVGCVAYRGYFDEKEARAMAVQLAAEGFDVDVNGVKAYSTLKWFNDPVLNTFLNGSDSHVAALVFHELAHQVVYVPNDCSFNEAFAKTVEMEGLRRWLQANSTAAEWQRYLDREALSEEFLAMLKRTRDELTGIYAQPLSVEGKRAAKREVFARLADELRGQKSRWPNPAAVDSWLERGLNNARLASIATYHDRVPAFQSLLRSLNGDLPAFYAEVGRLAKLSAAERTARLREFGKVDVDTACAELPAGFHN